MWEFLVLILTIGVVDKTIAIEGRSPYRWHALFVGSYAFARFGLGVWPLVCGAVCLAALFLALFIANMMAP